jgi:hypothetical protein
MSGRHKFSELEASMSPARRARIARLAEKLEGRMELKSADLSKKKPLSRSTAPSGTEPKEKKSANKSQRTPRKAIGGG